VFLKRAARAGGGPEGSAPEESAGFDAPRPDPPGTPPFRYVDNIACLTGGVDEGRRTVARCRALLGALGLQLRAQPEAEYLIDLRSGQATDLLGFKVSLSDGSMRYGTTDAALDSLRRGLRNAHEAANPPVAAQAVLVGWVNAMGPSFDRSRAGETVSQVLSHARTLGFKEFPLETVLTAWSSAYGRWNVKFLQPARQRARTSQGTP